MTREEAITNLNMISVAFVEPITKERRKLIDDTFEMAIEALEQEPCEGCDYKEWLKGEVEPFINKPCVSSGVCEHDKQKVLDKIRAEIADLDDADYDYEGYYKAVTDALQIIDKYKAESEDKE